MSLALTILGISLLIILHELGHFAVARACGMRVLRFSVGFGPTIFSKQYGDTIWQVAAIPLGGFVQVQGMGVDDEAEAAGPFVGPGVGFRERPVWQRAAVIFAGPAANWLIAAFSLAFLVATVGVRTYEGTAPRLGEILPGSPASLAGLQDGDLVTKIDEVPTEGVAASSLQPESWDKVVEVIRAHPEKPLVFTVRRGETEIQLPITPKKSEQGDFGMIGVAPFATVERFPAHRALIEGCVRAAKLTHRQASDLLGLITQKTEGQLTGLPGIVKMVSSEAKRGLDRLLESLAVLSVGLCLFNILPFPALDGGRLVFLIVEAIRRRPMNKVVETWVNAAGFIVILALVIFVSARDIWQS